MKIVMVSHYFASHRGGIEIVAEEIFRSLGAKDEELVWLASNVTPPPNSEGKFRTAALPASNVIEDRTGVPFPIPRYSSLAKIADEINKADVVILHDCLYLSNIFAFYWARSHGVPVIIIQHLGAISYNNLILNIVVRLANTGITQLMLSSADQVVFISETTRRYFENLSYVRAPEIVFNGVDVGLYRISENPKEKAALRRTFTLPEDRLAILFVGRFVEKKGISALKRMAELRPGWTWVFAGWGPLDPRNWKAANVRIFSNLRGSSLAELYRACDVLVLPSTGEGFPLVIQEALASGLGVVCGAETLAADPAMIEFAQGVPVNRENDEQTAREFLFAIDDFFQQDTHGDAPAEQRRAFAVSSYSWKRAADRYREIISRLVPISVRSSTQAEMCAAKIRQ